MAERRVRSESIFTREAFFSSQLSVILVPSSVSLVPSCSCSQLQQRYGHLYVHSLGLYHSVYNIFCLFHLYVVWPETKYIMFGIQWNSYLSFHSPFSCGI